MATFDSRKIVDEIIANNGYYMNDPQVKCITEYTNSHSNIAWGVEWDWRGKYYHNPPYVNNPKVIWKAEK